MTYTLVERDGILYAKESFIDPWEPREIVNWYRLTMPLDELALYVPDLKKKLGCILMPTINPPTVWKDDRGWRYSIFGGIGDERIPVYTEVTPIPEPVQRGHKYPLQWHQGAWHKQTKRGLVKLIV